MAPLGELAKRLEKIIIDNSPTILTVLGVTGAVTTAYLTGKASFKAAEIIAEETKYNLRPLDHNEDRPFRPLYAKEKVDLVWKLYIPPAVSGILTLAAIISANRVGSRRATALAAAYSIAEKSFDEYRTKIVEKLGTKKEQIARDEIAQDRVNKDPVSNREILITGYGNVLCREMYTGRYFHSDLETLRKAENDINHQVLHDSYASLSDFYTLVGLPNTTNAEEVGWNADRLLKLQFSTTIAEDGRPCICVDFAVSPVRHYYRLS